MWKPDEQNRHFGFNPILQDGTHAGLNPHMGVFAEWTSILVKETDIDKIREIKVYTASSQNSFVTRIRFADKNSGVLLETGQGGSFRRTFYLEEGERIVGLRAKHFDDRANGCICNLQFVIGRLE